MRTSSESYGQWFGRTCVENLEISSIYAESMLYIFYVTPRGIQLFSTGSLMDFQRREFHHPFLVRECISWTTAHFILQVRLLREEKRRKREQSGAYEAKVDRYACIGKPSRVSYRLYPRRSKRELDLSLSIF